MSRIVVRKRPGFSSLGLDISATSTGIVLLRSDAPKCKKPEVLLETAYAPTSAGMRRVEILSNHLLNLVQKQAPDRIVIEGYAISKFAGAVIQLVTVGAVVRYRMHTTGYRWLEPSPNELKKFVSGKGNVKKEHMMMEVLARWGHKSKNNDTADGYGLAAMGLAWSGFLDMTMPMREVVGKLQLC
jgi:Holliday junction resolvasome RuvABC endonuclease subunit